MKLNLLFMGPEIPLFLSGDSGVQTHLVPFEMKAAEEKLESLEMSGFIPDLVIIQSNLDDLNLKLSLSPILARLHVCPVLLLANPMQIRNQSFLLENGITDCIDPELGPEISRIKIRNWAEITQRLRSPFQPGFVSTSKDNRNNFIDNLTHIIEKHLSNENLDLETLSKEIHQSKSTIQKKLKRLANKSVSVYIREIRLNHAKRLLEESNMSISEIVDYVGFGGASYFSKCFKDLYGEIPSNWKKKIS
ncbi:MAG: AraC family transcriptional regulator [Bacteroidia bacterium]|nr:AraC family transcriptional regulator [Bacteroidia bacterium]